MLQLLKGEFDERILEIVDIENEWCNRIEVRNKIERFFIRFIGGTADLMMVCEYLLSCICSMYMI